jgi:hypothetical protein
MPRRTGAGAAQNEEVYFANNENKKVWWRAPRRAASSAYIFITKIPRLHLSRGLNKCLQRCLWFAHSRRSRSLYSLVFPIQNARMTFNICKQSKVKIITQTSGQRERPPDKRVKLICLQKPFICCTTFVCNLISDYCTRLLIKKTVAYQSHVSSAWRGRI